MKKYKVMSDEYLRETYVPDVYQPSIFAIDYQKLKDAGIKLISFDIDDTLADVIAQDPAKEVMTLFEKLKGMGFEIMLFTNAWKIRAKNYAKKLGLGNQYIYRAKKPLTTNFQAMQKRFGLEKDQMAHVGNNMRDDIAGGNAYGITTCLIRRAGITAGLLKNPVIKTEGQKIRDVMKKRGIWRKHHKDQEGDQYYQLGEKPAYMKLEDEEE